MSINMILGSAQSQTNSIKSLTTSQIGSYQQIQQALSIKQIACKAQHMIVPKLIVEVFYIH